jgi:predicted nucleotidyltransferase
LQNICGLLRFSCVAIESLTEAGRLCKMALKQQVVLKKVQKQLAEWIPEKYGWKRIPHRIIMRSYKRLASTTIGRKRWESNELDNSLGIDEFGRSVFEGMQIYVSMLQKRGLKLQTVLVLGSRAKGKWKPSSDIDAIVIADSLAKKEDYPWPLDKLMDLRELFKLSDIPLCMGLEASLLSGDRFLKMLKEFDIHALDAMYYGKIIYDNGYWQKATGIFRNLEQEYCLDKINLKRMLFVL